MSATIPPPPLPEFYLTTRSSADFPVSSSSSSEQSLLTSTKRMTKTQEQSVTFAQQTVRDSSSGSDMETLLRPPEKLPANPGDGTDERVMYVQASAYANLPGLAPNGVPPLAIYHICRLCLRPRSMRYHREHPIPINGVPPPPGICRRCRVTAVGEVIKNTAVVTRGESNDIKLGVSAFIPEDDYVSSKEMKERRSRHTQRSIGQSRSRERSANLSTVKEKKVVYRHVRVQQTAQAAPPVVKTSESSTSQDAIEQMRDSSPMMTTTVDAAALITSSEGSKKSVQSFAASMPSTSRVASVKASTSVRSGSQRAVTETWADVPTSLEVNAGASAKSATQIIAQKGSSNLPFPDRFEAEVRRIAHEEVERYRQAERKLEAHPDPYAHGRLVPVEKRIAQQAAYTEPMPWRESESRVKLKMPWDKDAAQNAELHIGVTCGSQRRRSERSTPLPSSERRHTQQVEHVYTIPNSPEQHDGSVLKSTKARSTVASIPSRHSVAAELWPQPTHTYEVEDIVEGVDRASEKSASQKNERQGKEGSVRFDRDAALRRGHEGQSKASSSSSISRCSSESESKYSEKTRWDGPQRDPKPCAATAGGSQPSRTMRQSEGGHATASESYITAPQRISYAGDAQHPEREYIYTRRTVEPAHPPKRSTLNVGSARQQRVPPSDRYGTDSQQMRGTAADARSHLRRVTPTETQVQPKKPHPLRHAVEVRYSEDSNHVRFASKVEFSPTPPGSDASSSHFRMIGPRENRQLDGGVDRGEQHVVENERRGRSRSRVPAERYERQSVRRLEGGRPLARALSESPSRELYVRTSQRSKVEAEWMETAPNSGQAEWTQDDVRSKHSQRSAYDEPNGSVRW